jgi:glutaredoxin
MDYYLFTYPNCSKCDALKKALRGKGLAYTEYSLVQSQGKAKIREFIRHVRRDEAGGIMLPTLILNDQGIVRAVITSTEELEQWLTSKG